MCGIIAIAGNGRIATDLRKGLKQLEYRGYDSCGLALFNQDRIEVKKNIGEVDHVARLENFTAIDGQIGIAHTRWATHGGVTQENSHPHLSNNKKFVIAHNGTLTNFQKLKNDLIEKGYSFLSETDSEIIVNLIEYYYEETQSVKEAFLKTTSVIEGSYTIVLFSQFEPDKLYAIKQDTPLVLGILPEKKFIASDVNAFIDQTKHTVIINDGEFLVVDKDQYALYKVNEPNKKIERKISVIDWDISLAQKNGFDHFMIKEIFDQPANIRSVFNIDLEEFQPIIRALLENRNSYFIGIGTTYYVALAGSYFFSDIAKRYIPAIQADEFTSQIPQQDQMHVLALSQSGETLDTKQALKYAKEKKATTSAVVNVMGSSISQIVDHCIYQRSGPEISVVSTKAALTQIIILLRMAEHYALEKNLIKREEVEKTKRLFIDFSNQIEKTLHQQSGKIKKIAEKTCKYANWFFLGRGIYFAMALEASLKMKEVAYLHAEGIPAGFLKHGTLALVDENVLSFFFLPPKADKFLYEATLTAIEEVKARNGKILAFVEEANQDVRDGLIDYRIDMPSLEIKIAPLYQLLISQLLAYYAASKLGRNVDKPRNLAKSVTVG